jgi:hypothetical protein
MPGRAGVNQEDRCRTAYKDRRVATTAAAGSTAPRMPRMWPTSRSPVHKLVSTSATLRLG